MKKTVHKNWRIEIAPRPLGYAGAFTLPDERMTSDVNRAYRDRCEEIARIVGSLPDVASAVVKFDSHDECAFCGADWDGAVTPEGGVDRDDPDDCVGYPWCCKQAQAAFKATCIEEKATAPAATATPAGPLGAGARNRLKLLRRTVIDNGGTWTTRRAQRLYEATYGPGDWRATARRDLQQLHREGLLVEHDDNPARHHYTVTTRNGGTA